MPYQPGDRVLKQHERPLVAQPGTTVEPTDEPEMPWLVRKISVAVELADRPCMLPLRIIAVEIAWEIARILNGKLVGEESHDRRGNSEWVGQECAQKPNGTELQSEPKTLVTSVMAANYCMVIVIEVENFARREGSGSSIYWP